LYEHKGKKILIRASEEEAARLYYDIARHATTDLGLAKTITAAVFHVDAETPLYAAAVRTRPTVKPVRLADVALVEEPEEEEPEEVKITIIDETYSPEVIATLNRVFGNLARQTDRDTIIVHLPEGLDPADLKDIIVHDPRERLAQRVYDLIERVRPEGFRVARYARVGRDFLYASTEEVFQDHWLDLLFELRGDLDEIEF